MLKTEGEAGGFQHFSPGLANVMVDGKNMFLLCLLVVTSFNLHSQSTHNVWSEVLKTEGDCRSLRLSTLAFRL